MTTTQAPPTPQPTHEVDTLRHLRVLEERIVNLRRKAQLTDDKLLQAEQKLTNEVKAFTQELTELRRSMADMQENLKTVQAEMAHAASQYDLKALEKYVAYWEPLAFVTKDELVRKQNLLKERAGK
jgi:hypothetical protein